MHLSLDLSPNNHQHTLSLNRWIELCRLLKMKVPKSCGKKVEGVVKIRQFVAVDI